MALNHLAAAIIAFRKVPVDVNINFRISSYTFIGSAKLVGIDPQDTCATLIERIADHPSNPIDELLPWAVAGELAKAAPTSSHPTHKLAASSCRRWQNCRHAGQAD